MANVIMNCGGFFLDDTNLELNDKTLSVKQMNNQANTTAEDVATLVSDFNTLLSALKTAGLMKTE